MTVIVIDGNIGSGKSTILEMLNLNGFKTVNENLDNFEPWLKQYYENMKKYSLGFQIEVLLSHMKNKYLISDNKLHILERSPLSCLKIFGQHLLDANILSPIEQNLCNKLNNEYGWLPKNIIYLKTSPETAYNRVINRDRKSENSISKEYITSLNNYYNKLYDDENDFNIHVIDANRDVKIVYGDVIKVINNYM